MARGGKRKGTGPKPRNIVKSKNHSIKFTDAEWEIIKQKAINEKSASDYIRKKALQ